MALARMMTPGGTERPTSRLSPARYQTGRMPPSPDASLVTDTMVQLGSKLATFDWPPPPSPAGASRPSAASPRRKGGTGNTLGTSGELEASDSATAAASADMQNRAHLWAIRAEIERDKLKQWVAPFPFFGCPMRFSDEYAALQITEDGRFSFSEMCLVQALEATETEASPSKIKPLETRRVVTYEGVFTGTYMPPPEEDEQAAGAAAMGKSRGKKEASMKAMTTKAKAKDTDAEELSLQGPELAGIEGTALVKHEIIDSGGRSRLVLVERGVFRFAITVSPFFHPTHATLKVLARNDRHQAAHRGRRLPYVGTGGPCKAAGPGVPVKRSDSFAALPQASPKPGGLRMKNSRSAVLLPSVSPQFRNAAAGNLAFSQTASPWGLGCGKSSWSSGPQAQMGRSTAALAMYSR